MKLRNHRSLVRRAAVACALSLGCVAPHRTALPASTAPASAEGPAHDTFTIRSTILGEPRSINVHTPVDYRRSSTTFPVVYMPDGGLDEDFPHIVRAVDSLVANGVIRPVIVVGVPNTERRRDLTGPTRVASDSAVAPHIAGSPAFRRFLRDELIPTIDARYRTTSERAIIGESLAGLFVVETLLREPTLFAHYVAFDPSLWWNHGSLVDSSATLLRAAPPGVGRLTLFIASSRDDIDAQTTRLADSLRLVSRPTLILVYDRRPDLTHATIFRALEATGLAAALR